MAGSIDVNVNTPEGLIGRFKAIDSNNKTVTPLTSGSGDNQGMTYYYAKQIEEVIGKIEWSFDFLVILSLAWQKRTHRNGLRSNKYIQILKTWTMKRPDAIYLTEPESGKIFIYKSGDNIVKVNKDISDYFDAIDNGTPPPAISSLVGDTNTTIPEQACK